MRAEVVPNRLTGMLDMFMTAAEPFGAWGPGPVVETLGGSAKLFDAIASDPRAVANIIGAVATIIAAFFGFLGGVLIKYKLDQRLDRKRRYHESILRKDEVNALAIAFRSEIDTLLSDAKNRLALVSVFERAASPVANVARFDIPSKIVYSSNTHRLGDTGPEVANSIIRAHGHADHIRHLVATTRSETPLTKVYLDGLRDHFLQLINLTVKAHSDLDEFLKCRKKYPESANLVAEAATESTRVKPTKFEIDKPKE